MCWTFYIRDKTKWHLETPMDEELLGSTCRYWNHQVSALLQGHNESQEFQRLPGRPCNSSRLKRGGCQVCLIIMENCRLLDQRQLWHWVCWYHPPNRPNVIDLLSEATRILSLSHSTVLQHLLLSHSAMLCCGRVKNAQLVGDKENETGNVLKQQWLGSLFFAKGESGKQDLIALSLSF